MERYETYKHYRDLQPAIEHEITLYYEEKGYTVYDCFVWYDSLSKNYYLSLECGNGTPSGYFNFKGNIELEKINAKYNTHFA